MVMDGTGYTSVFSSEASIPPLEPQASVVARSAHYAGPSNESNWVIPGRLLVGAFPATPNDAETTALLCAILAEGVGTFVCLQDEFRLRGVSEQQWRSGQLLRPYFRDVVEIARRVEALKKQKPWVAPQFVAADGLAFVHYPIKDLGIGEDESILRLAIDLCERVRRGETMYMHCWGGHGRTGTLVSVMLSLLYGLSAEESMQRCQLLHDMRKIYIPVGSPQTDTQRDQVKRLVSTWRQMCAGMLALQQLQDQDDRANGASNELSVSRDTATCFDTPDVRRANNAAGHAFSLPPPPPAPPTKHTEPGGGLALSHPEVASGRPVLSAGYNLGSPRVAGGSECCNGGGLAALLHEAESLANAGGP